MHKAELIADYHCACGEGPLWHPLDKHLYWLDIVNPRMFRYNPKTGQHEQFNVGRTVGGFTVQADGALLLFMDRGAVGRFYNGKLTVLIDHIPGEEEGRFNDVYTDSMGRVFCGTMPIKDRLGSLYRLDTDGKLHKMLSGINISNGMALTPDRKHMYYTESMTHKIFLFDYDEATGNLNNQRIFVHSDPKDGVPDGMTVDALGYVWSAHWDGSCLIRYAPTGAEVLRIPFDVKKVSSITFGGDDYTDAYVTTAGGDHKDTDGQDAGALFRIKGLAQGLPDFCSQVLL
jgi:D-xylonolactonase